MSQKKDKQTKKRKNRTSSHNIFKFKMTEETKKYKSIYYSHFEGQTDWFSNAYLLFGYLHIVNICIFFFSVRRKKFKLAYFFLYRLCKVIINEYKQTNKN